MEEARQSFQRIVDEHPTSTLVPEARRRGAEESTPL
jgi:hypothetical protein